MFESYISFSYQNIFYRVNMENVPQRTLNEFFACENVDRALFNELVPYIIGEIEDSVKQIGK